MNQLMNLNQARTMSSREIAQLTEKRHDNVIADIRKLLDELQLSIPDFSGVYLADNGQEYECFNLPKRETLILVSGYSIPMRAKIIDRWQELETQQFTELTNLSPILQFLIQTEQKQKQLELQVTQQSAAIADLSHIVNQVDCFTGYYCILGFTNSIS